MTQPIPEKEPQTITSGDYIQWKKTLSDYPAPTWVLSYALVKAGNNIAITAAADGSDHLVTLSTATTEAYAEGVYQWQAYVTSGSQRKTIASGEIEIIADFATAQELDTRSHAKRVLEAIEAVIEGRASKDQQEYTIGNRSLKLTPISDLVRLRDKYRAIYLSEQNAEKVKNGSAPKNRIYVRI